MATGDIRIDSLLADPYHTLARSLNPGTAVEITYSFVGYTSAQASAISAMLAEVSTQIGVTFKQVNQGGILTYAFYTVGPTLADGSPSSGYMQMKSDNTGATVWLNSSMAIMQDLSTGTGHQVALHETGHALGLKHPGNYSSADTGPYLPIDLAKANHTVMAYFNGDTQHLGDYDILALQYIYGAPSHPAALNVMNVTPNGVTGGFFNDRLVLDTSVVTSSVRVTGGTGTDLLDINVSSTSATFQSGLQQFTYTKADGSYAGIFLDGVERVKFTDKSIALDVAGNAGQAYRLYKAAFDRAPDKTGLGFWIKELDNGATLSEVATKFIASPEFINLNGANPTNLEFATSLYQHVLGRLPDQDGLSWWVNQLDTGARSRSDVLMGFSESSENQIALTGQIQGGIEYIPY